MMKKILALFCVLFLSESLEAQEIQLSNLHASLTSNNTAFFGNNNAFNASFFHRSQWKNAASKFDTKGFSIGSKISSNKDRSGTLAAGINFFQDQNLSKSFSLNVFQASAVYHLKINNFNKLSSSIYAGYNSMQINQNNGTWASQHDGIRYDAGLSNKETNLNYSERKMDGGVSFVYSFYKNQGKFKINEHKALVQVAYANNHIQNILAKDKEHFFPFKQNLTLLFNLELKDIPLTLSPILSYSNQNKFSTSHFGLKSTYELHKKGKYSSNYALAKQNNFSYAFYISQYGNLTNSIGLAYENVEFFFTYDYFFGKVSSSLNKSGIELGLTYSILSYKKSLN